MINQSKVTDFFASQKKSDRALRSAKKITQNISESAVNESDVDHFSVPEVRTPKRKKEVSKDKTILSSKKKKSSNEDIIELKANQIETKEVKNQQIISSGAKPSADPRRDEPMTANKIKETLKKCNNLLALKKQLSAINDCAAKIKQFKEIKIKTSSKTTNNDSKCLSKPIESSRVTTNLNGTQTSRRRLFNVYEDEISSPQKADNMNINLNKNQRTVERINYSLNNSEDSPTLVLPQKFKVLSDSFKAIDTIVSMHHKRQEVCTFHKLKTSVERMTNRNFDLKNLAQIQTLFPNAFKLKYQLYSTVLSNQKSSHQLVITPVYNPNVDKRLNSSHLLERYQIFVSKLLETTKRHHKQYLSELGITVEDNDLIRWHPKFLLDSVPDIEINDNALPPEPKFEAKSAENFLETTRHRLGLPSVVNTAFNRDDSNDNQNSDEKPMNSGKKITKGLLKGISVDLLNKIRAKEAANLVQEMTRKPEVENELRILRTLPELVRIIHSYYVGSKKLAVHYDVLIDKLINSFSACLSILRAREHIDYLCALLPDWIYSLEVKSGKYIRINKQSNLSALEDRINQKINLLKSIQ